MYKHLRSHLDVIRHIYSSDDPLLDVLAFHICLVQFIRLLLYFFFFLLRYICLTALISSYIVDHNFLTFPV